jgi:hypothetical protein
VRLDERAQSQQNIVDGLDVADRRAAVAHKQPKVRSERTISRASTSVSGVIPGGRILHQLSEHDGGGRALGHLAHDHAGLAGHVLAAHDLAPAASMAVQIA